MPGIQGEHHPIKILAEVVKEIEFPFQLITLYSELS